MGMDLLAIALTSFWAWLSFVILGALIILGIYFWIIEFAQLMALGDGDFPGRHDKALWVGAFVFTFVLAALAFVVWQRTILAMGSERSREPAIR